MQKYNSDIHKRKSIRLTGYDYGSVGLYFVTICINKNICLFWEISGTHHNMFESGKMIEKYWYELTDKHENIILHEHIVMPNHFHGIIEITKSPQPCDCKICRGTPCGYPEQKDILLKEINTQKQGTHSLKQGTHNLKQGTHKGHPYRTCMYNRNTLWNIIWAFKSETTNEYIKQVRQNNWQPFYKKLWQRNYHEHIIRDESSYLKFSQYIRNNPTKWKEDKFYIKNI